MPQSKAAVRHSENLPLPVTQDVAGSSPVHPATFYKWKTQTPEGFPSFEPEGFFVGNALSKERKVGQKPAQVGHQLGHASLGFLTVKEASDKLAVSVKTVTRWCKSGRLPAITRSYGSKITYIISLAAVQEILTQAELEKEQQTKSLILPQPSIKSHSVFLEPWLSAMENGLITGKPFSRATIDDYHFYVKPFWEKWPQVSIESLKEELSLIPTNQVAKRQHLYKALVCFGKFLVSGGALSEDFIEQVKPFYPKRHIPPKRPSVDAAGLKSLLAHCETEQDRLIIMLLSHTGLRATETCALKWEDINFEKGVLLVALGKGGKRRAIGIGAALQESFKLYLETISKPRKDDFIFVNRLGGQMNRRGLYQRLERLGLKANVKVSPHALRRAFVTINANKGRPLQMLQMACGHSDIKTTMSYCRTSEQEVVDAMKGWD